MSSDAQDPDIERLADDIAAWVRGGDSEERAASRLIGYNIPEDKVRAAQRLFGERIGRIRDVRDPRTLLAEELRTGGWYAGPQPGDVYWPAFRERLQLDEDAIKAVDRSSDRIVSLLSRPGAEVIRTRGLVLGYVQSGKTTSFMSVIAKAADAGYRMFIVLSGITDSLRSQTQDRLDELLVGRDRERWRWLTEPDRDFAHSPFTAPNLLRDDGSRVIAVVKKNPYRLRRLAAFLDGAGDRILQSCPILLIDDEADQATIDIGQRGRVSRINALIRRILAKPKVAYVAYTATPFANLLIHPGDYEGLYPRHFIVDLGPRPGYFGAEKIFGRDLLDVTDDYVDESLDVVRHVPNEDVSAVRPAGRANLTKWTASVPDSLASALRWFILATAARRVRDGERRHSTMLIHTSMLTAAHERLRRCVQEHIDSLTHAVRIGDADALAVLEKQWGDECARVPAATQNLQAVHWAEVQSRLSEVLNEIRLYVDNHLSAERLTYPKDDPRIAVVIGGNTLSRGLTLEGLVCSYFVRSANAYDTLLQMGRWFGYRRGYSDLVRIWMTAELEGWFFDLATVEAEIRQQIQRYEAEGLTPESLPVKIRTHPAMVVTAAAKMRDKVDAEVSYGGTREQTILFEHKDADWLRHNIDAAGRLLTRAATAGASKGTGPLGGLVLRGVPVEVVTDFLVDYQFHSRAQRLRPALLNGYIRLQNRFGALRTWNVAVISGPPTPGNTIQIAGEEIGLIQRSRLAMPNITHANIKSLVSRIDRAADLELSRDEIMRMAGEDTDPAYARLRNDFYDGIGLICLYPISKDSRPAPRPVAPGQRARVPLEAADHVIGVALFFPEDKSDRPYHYIAANIAGLADDSDEPDVDQLDREDENRGQAEETNSSERPKGIA